MTESEPSAPLPETVALGDYEAACRNLAAAIERAKRAERERDEARQAMREMRPLPCDGLCGDYPEEDCSRHGRSPAELWAMLSELNDNGRAIRAERDQARARLAKVREIAEKWEGWSRTRSTARIDAFRDAASDILAALDPVGATEDEAKP